MLTGYTDWRGAVALQILEVDVGYMDIEAVPRPADSNDTGGTTTFLDQSDSNVQASWVGGFTAGAMLRHMRPRS